MSAANQNIKTSIVVLCFNGLEEATRPCIDSIYRNTPREDFELIVVDNASSDGTGEYLCQLENEYSNITIQLNESNKGYAGGNNDGMRLARGEYLVLLNNDTLVPPGWLDRLLPLLEDRSVGLVGPVTNSAGNEQRIELPGLDEGNFENISGGYAERQRGVWFSTGKLGFFCVAMRRDLLNQIGYLDEAYGIGMFEDDDYCMRVMEHGYTLAVTESCFVYHKGSVSFKKLSNEDYRIIFEKNRELFFKKHNILWAYSDIAKALWEKISRDLGLCKSSAEEGASAWERISVRITDMNNIIYQLRSLEEGYAQFHGKPFNVIEKNRELQELSEWATLLKHQVDSLSQENAELKKKAIEISDWAVTLKDTATALQSELEQIKKSKWFALYRLFH